MVVKKINRINLLELNQITIRCQHCGASVTVNADSLNYKLPACTACMEQYGNAAEDIINSISKAVFLAGRQKEFSVEFDVEE